MTAGGMPRRPRRWGGTETSPRMRDQDPWWPGPRRSGTVVIASAAGAQRGDESLEFPVLGEQVFLDLKGFVQHRLGGLVNVLCPLV